MLFQTEYFANYAINLLQSIVCVLFVYFFVKIASNTLFKEADETQRSKLSFSLSVSILIAFGIGLTTMFIIAFVGWYVIFFQMINNIYFNFALIVTFVFPFYKLFLNKFGQNEILLLSSESRRITIKRNIFLIIISWAVVGLFLLVDLLSIPIGEFIPHDTTNPNYDRFLLAFEWMFFILIIYVVITRIVLKFIPLNKRPPKQVSYNSQLYGGFLAFGVWSIQLIVVELFLSRFFGITLYIQDIRLLAIAILILYLTGFLISMKFKYLPSAIEADQKLIKEKMQSIKRKDLEVEKSDVVLNVENLVTRFYTEEGVVHAVEGVSFKVLEGEVVGLVGETGCGKSVTALSILQLIQTPGKILEGKVEFEGEDLLKKSKSEILNYRGAKITMIFQDPLNSLNPVFTVGKQISEVFLLHKKEELLVEASDHKDKSIYRIGRKWSEELLKDLNIPDPSSIIDRYPHELSGGMRQRIQIAMGIACSPKLLIADEPTTALDVTVQNQILKLMKDLKQKYNTSILFITHDLGIISKMCDRVAVMYSGSIVEYGPMKKLFTKPYHPYTKGLLSAVPVEGKENEELVIIQGMVPNLIYPPSGCRFHPRCPNRFEPCDLIMPKSIEVEQNYYTSCHLYDQEYNVKKVLNK